MKKESFPLYRCHKIVGALKIADFETSSQWPDGVTIYFEEIGFEPILVNKKWCDKHQPSRGGYYVVYDDGYTSYSPADAFEKGYTKISEDLELPYPVVINANNISVRFNNGRYVIETIEKQ